MNSMITEFSILPAGEPRTAWASVRHILPRVASRVRRVPGVLGRSALFIAALLVMQSHLMAQATMTISLVDNESGEPIPCRIELRDANGRPQKTRGAMNRMPWSVVDGQFIFKGRKGDYQFDVFHGYEYASGGGGFTLDKDGEGSDVIRLPRYADMAKEGWFAGDLLTQIPRGEVIPWLAAEGLQTASIIGPAEAAAEKPEALGNRWITAGSYYDDRASSGLVLHNWLPPAAVPEHVPSSRLLVMAKQNADAHAEIAKLWAPDVPIWLASGRIDSIQILSDHLTRDGKTATRVNMDVHPEPAMFKGPRGPGRMVEQLYWKVLDAGLRIPPSAGTGVGKTSSPLGYNRVYAWLDKDNRTQAAWWDALRQGRSFVTNGPLLRARINRQWPGHVFEMPEGSTLSLDVALDLTVADPVEYVDVLFNGEAIYHARLDEYARQGGKIPALQIKESGWIMVRVVTGREETYRLATTAPYYVVFNSTPRIDRSACELFLHWLERTIAEQRKANVINAQAAEPFYNAALEFWRDRLSKATNPR